HLAVDKRRLAFAWDKLDLAIGIAFQVAVFIFFGGDNARLDHFVVKVVAFTRTFADARKYGETAAFDRDVTDEFNNQNGRADACATEQTNFSAARIRSQQIDNFDARLKCLDGHFLLSKRWRCTVDWQMLLGVHRTLFIDGFAHDVQNTAENFRTHG